MSSLNLFIDQLLDLLMLWTVPLDNAFTCECSREAPERLLEVASKVRITNCLLVVGHIDIVLVFLRESITGCICLQCNQL